MLPPPARRRVKPPEVFHPRDKPVAEFTVDPRTRTRNTPIGQPHQRLTEDCSDHRDTIG